MRKWPDDFIVSENKEQARNQIHEIIALLQNFKDTNQKINEALGLKSLPYHLFRAYGEAFEDYLEEEK